jgi:putative ABC transport system substrate-binding protein
MRTRILAALLFGFPVIAIAQQPTKIPRIGYLSLGSAPAEAEVGFKQELRDLGWFEGQNITIEYRWAAGKLDRLAFLAEELVRLKVDVILASTTPAIQAAKNATTSIPIVMMGAADPVGIGFVASLARPGGNITGLSLQSPELLAKGWSCSRKLFQSSLAWPSWLTGKIQPTNFLSKKPRTWPRESVYKFSPW